ncbi:MAG: hypothetical protein ABIN56_05065 [Dokdonella sp.]
MKIFKSTLVAAALMCMSTFAFANDEMKHEGMMHEGMKGMDANGDGMISKDEFMKFHEAKFDKMPKNKDGMVMMKDMEMMHHDKMMKHDEMMKKDSMKDGGGH